MIQSFQCSDTQALFAGKRVAKFANFEAVALRKLQQVHAATVLEFLRVPPGNPLEASKATAKASTAYASIANGVCALCGPMATPIALKLLITTEGEPPCPAKSP